MDPRSAAAVRIQALVRGAATRRRLAREHAAARAIQRLWRGHAGRMAVKATLQEEIAGLLLQIYQRAAIKIQAAWRGYWVRKTVFCYRLYVIWKDRCLERGQALMQEMLKQRLRMEAEDRYKAEIEAERCSQLVLRKLHHLVSTKATPGVFNSPRNPSVRAVEEGLRRLKFRPLSRMEPSCSPAFADQVRALDWEATKSRNFSVQRAIRLPKIWKMRLRGLQTIAS